MTKVIEKSKAGKGNKGLGERVSLLNKVVKKAFSEKMTFE